jgi:hypothetical protein
MTVIQNPGIMIALICSGNEGPGGHNFCFPESNFYQQ